MQGHSGLKLQSTFLNNVRSQNIPVVIYLIGGQQLKGTIKGFDNFVIILESAGKINMIYKHAVSTIIPTKEIELFTAVKENSGQKETEVKTEE